MQEPSSSSSASSGRERRRLGKLKQQRKLYAARERIHELEAQIGMLHGVVSELTSRTQCGPSTSPPAQIFNLYSSEVCDAGTQTDISVAHWQPDVFVAVPRNASTAQFESSSPVLFTAHEFQTTVPTDAKGADAAAGVHTATTEYDSHNTACSSDSHTLGQHVGQLPMDIVSHNLAVLVKPLDGTHAPDAAQWVGLDRSPDDRFPGQQLLHISPDAAHDVGLSYSLDNTQIGQQPSKVSDTDSLARLNVSPQHHGFLSRDFNSQPLANTYELLDWHISPDAARKVGLDRSPDDRLPGQQLPQLSPDAAHRDGLGHSPDDTQTGQQQCKDSISDGLARMNVSRQSNVTLSRDFNSQPLANTSEQFVCRIAPGAAQRVGLDRSPDDRFPGQQQTLVTPSTTHFDGVDCSPDDTRTRQQPCKDYCTDSLAHLDVSSVTKKRDVTMTRDFNSPPLANTSELLDSQFSPNDQRPGQQQAQPIGAHSPAPLSVSHTVGHNDGHLPAVINSQNLADIVKPTAGALAPDAAHRVGRDQCPDDRFPGQQPRDFDSQTLANASELLDYHISPDAARKLRVGNDHSTDDQHPGQQQAQSIGAHGLACSSDSHTFGQHVGHLPLDIVSQSLAHTVKPMEGALAPHAARRVGLDHSPDDHFPGQQQALFSPDAAHKVGTCHSPDDTQTEQQQCKDSCDDSLACMTASTVIAKRNVSMSGDFNSQTLANNSELLDCRIAPDAAPMVGCGLSPDDHFPGQQQAQFLCAHSSARSSDSHTVGQQCDNLPRDIVSPTVAGTNGPSKSAFKLDAANQVGLDHSPDDPFPGQQRDKHINSQTLANSTELLVCDVSQDALPCDFNSHTLADTRENHEGEVSPDAASVIGLDHSPDAHFPGQQQGFHINDNENKSSYSEAAGNTAMGNAVDHGTTPLDTYQQCLLYVRKLETCHAFLQSQSLESEVAAETLASLVAATQQRIEDVQIRLRSFE